MIANLLVFTFFFFQLSKLLTCLFITLIERRSISKWLSLLHENILADPLTTLKVAIPSFVYVVQNNLQFIAASNLDAATFQVTYQLKILTTALFSVFILGKKLRKMKWFSLFLLFIGIALVQVQPSMSSTGPTKQNPLIGLLAVLVACLCSGFAGVYFEKILKGTGNQNSAGQKCNSLWLRNIQLGLFGCILALCGMLINDGAIIKEKGLFYGYDWFVGWVIFIQAFGGLLVAVVVKYADNILKGFATSFAIIISCIVSMFLFEFIMGIHFIIGTSFVLISNYLYSVPDPK